MHASRPFFITLMHHGSIIYLMVILASLFPGPTSAQRSQHWQRATPPNALPEVPGAAIDHTNLIVEKEGVLVNYISNNVTFSTATRALIVIHGIHRDGWNAFIAAQESLAVASRFDIAIPPSTVIMAPLFFNEVDSRRYQDAGGSPPGQTTPSPLVWKSDSWIDGDNSLYPSRAQNSSFTALDAAISYLTNKNIFPKIADIVLAGHSAGGQIVQRYAILGKDSPSGVAIRYVISSPSSYCYFSDTRLHTDARQCNATYNNWKYGFGRCNNSYGASLLATDTTRQQVISRYFVRDIRYLLGTADDREPSDMSCEAMMQGTTRLERGLTWWRYITEEFSRRGAWINKTQTVGIVNGVGHDAQGIFSSKEGLTAILNISVSSCGLPQFRQFCGGSDGCTPSLLNSAPGLFLCIVGISLLL